MEDQSILTSDTDDLIILILFIGNKINTLGKMKITSTRRRVNVVLFASYLPLHVRTLRRQALSDKSWGERTT